MFENVPRKQKLLNRLKPVSGWCLSTGVTVSGWCLSTSDLVKGWCLYTGNSVSWCLSTGDKVSGWCLSTGNSVSGWYLSTGELVSGWCLTVGQFSLLSQIWISDIWSSIEKSIEVRKKIRRIYSRFSNLVENL